MKREGVRLFGGLFLQPAKQRFFLILLLSFGLISFFQNCAPGKIHGGSIDPSVSNLSSITQCPSPPAGPNFSSPVSLDIGSQVSGYSIGNALYPEVCRANNVTRTCLETTQWSGSMPIYSSCIQMCVHPESTATNPKTAMPGEHYITFSKSRGQNQAECDAAKVDSVCNADAQNPGTFLPAVPMTVVSKTCSVDPICPYTNGTGYAVPVTKGGDPNHPRPNDTVTGYLNGMETYPNLCGGVPKVVTCLQSGDWSIPISYLYQNCVQNCFDPVAKKPIPQGTSVLYWSVNAGSQAECDAALVTSVCQATSGLFNPTIPATAYAKCTVVNPPAINMFTATPATIISGDSVSLNWKVTNFTSLRLSDGTTDMDVSAVTSGTVKPIQNTTYTLTATFSVNGFTSKAATSSVAVIVNQPPATIASFVADKTTINKNGSVNFTWQVAKATKVTLTAEGITTDVTGVTPGAKTIQFNTKGNRNCVLTATGADGNSVSSTIAIVVQ